MSVSEEDSCCRHENGGLEVEQIRARRRNKIMRFEDTPDYEIRSSTMLCPCAISGYSDTDVHATITCKKRILATGDNHRPGPVE
jgi:hypothetical protein